MIRCFQSNPKESHLHVIKRIFIYLQGTQEFVLWYPKDSYFTLHAYKDVYWDGTVDERERTSGGAFYVGS